MSNQIISCFSSEEPEMQSFTSRREENIFVKFSENKVTETAEDSPAALGLFSEEETM